MTVEVKVDGLDDTSKLKQLKLATNYPFEGVAVNALDVNSSKINLVYITRLSVKKI